ncbi:MAG: hypothetical protein Tsb002_35830 [Wenzhouxiangellaceae bacterium]
MFRAVAKALTVAAPGAAAVWFALAVKASSAIAMVISILDIGTDNSLTTDSIDDVETERVSLDPL